MAAGLRPNEGDMNTSGTSAAELRSFVERIQRLEGEIADINSDKRDVYTEAKSKGFDVTALKAVVSYLRKDHDKAEYQRSIFELYLAQAVAPVGTGNATRARARPQLAASTSSPPTRGDEAVPRVPSGTASPIPDSAADPTQVTSLPGSGNLAGTETSGHSLSETDVVGAPVSSIVEPAVVEVSIPSDEIEPDRETGLPAGSHIPDTDPSLDIRNQPFYRGGETWPR
jgi:uncharacterized protein (UPF0335 family)